MNDTDSGVIVPLDTTDDDMGPPQAETGEGLLLTRFLLGLLLMGSDELMARLQALQPELEAGTELAASEIASEETTTRELLGYMAVGMFVRGQKRLSQGIRRGVRLSVGMTGRALGIVNHLTDNPLGRPVRRPVESLLWNLVQEGERTVREGRAEAQNARLLAGRTLAEITDDLMEYIIENPELMVLIRRQVGEQSTGLASTAASSARQLGAGADGAVEGAVRRLLRRPPRRELPPSPLPGDPQTVYVRRTSSGEDQDDR
jgi:hypothetical protein